MAYTAEEDTPLVKTDLLSKSTDADGDTLMLVNTTQPAHGTLTGVSESGGFTFTPTANWHGTDSFDFTVTDGNGGYATVTATVTVGEYIIFSCLSATCSCS